MFIYQQFFALSLVYLAGCGDDAPPAVNSAPEFGEDNYAFEVAENAATGDAVGTVSATDEENDELTYTVVGSRTPFDIGAGTGAVIVADSVALDFETTTSYSIRAQVSDGTNMDTADLTVTITNVNDNAPVFANTPYNFSVASDAADGDTDLVVGNFDGTLSIWYRYADTNTWETTSDAI